MGLNVFRVVVKVLVEKVIFLNLPRFVSAITENRYKHPNICNTPCISRKKYDFSFYFNTS
jgi:hypothetical protein